MGKSRSSLYGTFIGSITIIGNCAILSVLWYGSQLVINGELSTGQLTSFVLYTIGLSANLLGAGGIMNNVITAAGVAEKLFEYMEIEP